MAKKTPEDSGLDESISAINRALKEKGRPLSQFKKTFEANNTVLRPKSLRSP